MNLLTGRRFEPVVLGIDGAEPHPELAALLQMVRADKRVRALARSAAAQHRHLCDMTAFESYLSRAAMASIEQQIDPVAWLAQEIRNLQVEQACTREEHARMAARIAALVAVDGHTRTKPNLSHGHLVREALAAAGAQP